MSILVSLQQVGALAWECPSPRAAPHAALGPACATLTPPSLAPQRSCWRATSRATAPTSSFRSATWTTIRRR
eukprot:3395407-Prymnesium_polylepis.1